MLSQGVFNEELQKWERYDKKECCHCQNTYSTSPELFLVKFDGVEDKIYCNVCLGEGPLSEFPDKIKSITRVEKTFIEIQKSDLEALNAIKATLVKIAKSPHSRILWENSDYSDIICFATNHVFHYFEKTHDLNMHEVLKEKQENSAPKYKPVEIDIWTDKIERFRTEFASMNDVKFDHMEVIDQQGKDKRYSLFYRNFGGEINYPEQGYYQLKNAWGDGA